MLRSPCWCFTRPREAYRSWQTQGALPAFLASIAARFRRIHLTVPQLIHDHLLIPDDVAVSKLTLDDYGFAAAWTGEVVLLKRDYRITADEQPFSLRMIAGLLLQDRRIVRDIVISAFLLSHLAVAPIMFWRLLIDPVLYYQSINTFTVLCVGMAILIGFDTAFGSLRRCMVPSGGSTPTSPPAFSMRS
jgi:ABC-type bacteriocin/lantibiotic exporter with double-glycine peptidase domain